MDLMTQQQQKEKGGGKEEKEKKERNWTHNQQHDKSILGRK